MDALTTLRSFASRLLWLALALLACSAITFAILDILPGDPARAMLGMNATDEALTALHAKLGLDRPPMMQYLAWLDDLAHLRLGTSMTYDIPVAQLLSGRLAITLPLAAGAMTIALSLGLPFGAIAARRRHRADGVMLDAAAQLLQSVPDFWLGIALVGIFALHWRLAPSGGFPGWAHPAAALGALVLPALALALPQAAVLMRVMRSALISIEPQDFIRSARARGLSPARIFLRHALPHALLPVLTIATMQISFLIGGAVVIETVFDLPGLGRMLFDAVGNHDLVVLRDLVLLVAAAITLLSMLAEWLATRLDPRGQPR
jgi:peptide/nickel transport system permease protein